VPGINGYLAAAGDDRSLAKAISNALVLADLQDAEIIRQSVSNFTWSRVATRMLNAYDSTLANT
jgi:glycosyltransferase involved in cell wall biosynthesis